MFLIWTLPEKREAMEASQKKTKTKIKLSVDVTEYVCYFIFFIVFLNIEIIPF